MSIRSFETSGFSFGIVSVVRIRERFSNYGIVTKKVQSLSKKRRRLYFKIEVSSLESLKPETLVMGK